MAYIPLSIGKSATTADADAYQGAAGELWIDTEQNLLHVGTLDRRAGGVIVNTTTGIPANLGSMAFQASTNVSITGGNLTGVRISGMVQPLAIADGGTGANTDATARLALGLGTAATLNAGTAATNLVQLTVGGQLPALDGSLLTNVVAGAASIDAVLAVGSVSTRTASLGGITLTTPLAVNSGGTGANEAGQARANLGLGTLAVQNANNLSVNGGSLVDVNITGSTISNMDTPLAIADGGTAARTAIDAANNLGFLTGTRNPAYQLSIDTSGATAQGIIDLASGKWNPPAPATNPVTGLAVTSATLSTAGASLLINGGTSGVVNNTSGNNTGVGAWNIEMAFPQIVPDGTGRLGLPNNITGVIDSTTGLFALYAPSASGAGSVTSVGLRASNDAIVISNSPITSAGVMTAGLRYPVVSVTSSTNTVAGSLNMNTGILTLDSTASGSVTRVGLVATDNSLVVGNSPITSAGNLQIGMRYSRLTVTSTTNTVVGVLDLAQGTFTLDATASGTGSVTSVSVTAGAGITSTGSPITSAGSITVALKNPQVNVTGQVAGVINLDTGVANLTVVGASVFSDASLSGNGLVTNPLAVNPFVLSVVPRQTVSTAVSYTLNSSGSTTLGWQIKNRTGTFTLDGTTTYNFSFTLPANIPNLSAGWPTYFATRNAALITAMLNLGLSATIVQNAVNVGDVDSFKIQDLTNNYTQTIVFKVSDNTPNLGTDYYSAGVASGTVTFPAWGSPSVILGTGLQSALVNYLNPVYDARYVQRGYNALTTDLKIGSSNAASLILGVNNVDALRIASQRTQSVATTPVAGAASITSIGAAIASGYKYEVLTSASNSQAVIRYQVAGAAATGVWQSFALPNLSVGGQYRWITTYNGNVYILRYTGGGQYYLSRINTPATGGAAITVTDVTPAFTVYDSLGLENGQINAFDIRQTDGGAIAFVASDQYAFGLIVFPFSFTQATFNWASKTAFFQDNQASDVVYLDDSNVILYTGNVFKVCTATGSASAGRNPYNHTQGTFFAQPYVSNNKKWAIAQGQLDGEISVFDANTGLLTAYDVNTLVSFNNSVAGIGVSAGESDTIYGYYGGQAANQNLTELKIVAGTVAVQAQVDLKDKNGNLITGAGSVQNIANQAWRQSTTQTIGSGVDSVVVFNTPWTSNGDTGLTLQANGGFTNTSGRTQSYVVPTQITWDIVTATSAVVMYGVIVRNSTNLPTDTTQRYAFNDQPTTVNEYSVMSATDVITLGAGDTYFTLVWQNSGSNRTIGAGAAQGAGYANHIAFVALTPVSGAVSVGTIDQVLQQGNVTNRSFTAGAATLSGLTVPAAATVISGGSSGQLLSQNAAGSLAWIPAYAYTLPAATALVLGGVKQGTGVTILADGTLNVTGGGSYTLPVATTTILGGIKQGTGITVAADGTTSGNVATTNTLGMIQVGSGLQITAGGVLSVTGGGGGYTLPIATATMLGGIKIGTGLTIDAVTGITTLAPATTTALGGVKQGTGISIAADGTANLGIASSANLGGVKQGTGLTIDANGVISLNTFVVSFGVKNATDAGYTQTVQIIVAGNITATFNAGVTTLTGSGGGGGGSITIGNGTTTVANATSLTIGANMTLTSPSTGVAAINVPTMTATVLGVAKPSTGLAVDVNGNLSVSAAGATRLTLGGVYVQTTGSGLTLAADGRLSLNAPLATTTTAGQMIVGSTLTVTGGVVDYNLTVATSTVLGGVKIGGGINVAADGTISVPALAIPLLVEQGGTGGTTQATARSGLGLGTASTADTGTAVGNIPLLQAGGKLAPATVPAATSANLGGVSVTTSFANGVTVSGIGALTTQIASSTQLGSVKGGGTVSIASDGTMNVASAVNIIVTANVTARLQDNLAQFICNSNAQTTVLSLPPSNSISDGYSVYAATVKGAFTISASGADRISINGTDFASFIMALTDRLRIVWSSALSRWLLIEGRSVNSEAAAIRNGLALGTAALLNSGTTLGTLPLLGAGGVLGAGVLPFATGANIGAVKVGSTLTIDGTGMLDIGAASAASRGGIRVGAGLQIDANAVLSTIGNGYVGVATFTS